MINLLIGNRGGLARGHQLAQAAGTAQGYGRAQADCQQTGGQSLALEQDRAHTIVSTTSPHSREVECPFAIW